MNRNRLNRIEKMLRTDVSNYHLLAFEYPNHPENNKYMVWDGVLGSGDKTVTKEKWERMADEVSKGHAVKIIDDIPDIEQEKGKCI